MVTEQQATEDKGIRRLYEVIYSLQYRNAMDIEHLLNYPNENDVVMESSIDGEII